MDDERLQEIREQDRGPFLPAVKELLAELDRVRAQNKRLREVMSANGWMAWEIRQVLGEREPEPEPEPTALAWTPDEVMEKSVARFKELWPDKWAAWVAYCRETGNQGDVILRG